MKKINNKKGFTLIEVLLYTAIFAIVAGLTTGILLTVTQVQQRESASAEVTGQLNFVMQRLRQIVSESSNIEIEAGITTSTLKLRMKDTAKDPTCLSLVSGVIKLAEGPGTNPNECTTTTSDLTSNRVIVDTLNFKKFTQYPGHDTLSLDIQMTYNSQNPKSRVQRTLSSAIARVSAATFDSDVVPGGVYNYTLGQAGAPWQKVIMADGTAANPSYTFGSNTGLGLFAASSTTILGFTTAGAERMRIDASGNVGIGTTEPGNKLHIASGQNDGIRVGPGPLIGGVSTEITANELIQLELNYDRLGAQNTGYWGGAFTIDTRSANDLFHWRARDTTGVEAQLVTISRTGNVGIGTTAPASKLDVNGQITISGGEATTYGLKALRLPTGISNIDAGLSVRFATGESIVQFGNNLFSGYTGAVDSDKAGVMVRLDTRNAAGSTTYSSSAYTLFQIQTRAAGVVDTHTVPFQLRAAPTGSFIMDSEGDIGLGGLPGTAKLYVNGNVGIGTTGPAYQLELSTDSAAKPGTNTWTVVSDARIKTDIRPFTDGLNTILGINPVLYKYNGKGGFIADGKDYIGVIAQDVQKVAPYTVNSYYDKLNPADATSIELLNFNSGDLTFTTINAIKELNNKIEALRLENEALKKRIEILETR